MMLGDSTRAAHSQWSCRLLSVMVMSLCLVTLLFQPGSAVTAQETDPTMTRSIFLDFVTSSESGEMIEERSVTNVLETVMNFIESGLPISPPCVRALEDTTFVCDMEVDEIMREVQQVKKDLQLVRSVLDHDTGERSNNDKSFTNVSELMAAVKKQLEQMSTMTTNSYGKVDNTEDLQGEVHLAVALGIEQEEETIRRPTGVIQPERGDRGGVGLPIDPITGYLIMDEKTKVVNAAIQLGRKIQDTLYKQAQQRNISANAVLPPSLEEIMLGTEYYLGTGGASSFPSSFSSSSSSSSVSVRKDDVLSLEPSTLASPSLFEVFAAQAQISSSCCQAVDKLLKYSTCLCDKGIFGSVLQSKWTDMTRRMRVAVRETANMQCQGVAALPDDIEDLQELRTLDQTKVCKCRSLLATISETQAGENSNVQMVQSFSGAQQTDPLLRSRNHNTFPRVHLDKALQFESLNEASRFFTEQKITAFDADQDTADLIRTTCL